jgi:hypothetical protein
MIQYPPLNYNAFIDMVPIFPSPTRGLLHAVTQLLHTVILHATAITKCVYLDDSLYAFATPCPATHTYCWVTLGQQYR